MTRTAYRAIPTSVSYLLLSRCQAFAELSVAYLNHLVSLFPPIDAVMKETLFNWKSQELQLPSYAGFRNKFLVVRGILEEKQKSLSTAHQENLIGSILNDEGHAPASTGSRWGIKAFARAMCAVVGINLEATDDPTVVQQHFSRPLEKGDPSLLSSLHDITQKEPRFSAVADELRRRALVALQELMKTTTAKLGDTIISLQDKSLADQAKLTCSNAKTSRLSTLESGLRADVVKRLAAPATRCVRPADMIR